MAGMLHKPGAAVHPYSMYSMNLGRAWESTFLMVPKGFRDLPPHPLWEPPLQIYVALGETPVLLTAPRFLVAVVCIPQ